MRPGEPKKRSRASLSQAKVAEMIEQATVDCYIERLYLKRFGRERPEVVMSVEQRARAKEAKRVARNQARRRDRVEGFGVLPGGA